MATYDAETNTIDGKPIDRWKVAETKVIKAGDFDKRDANEEGRPIYGYGLLVLIALFVLGWVLSGGWVYALGFLYFSWPFLLAASLLGFGIYAALFMPSRE